MAHRPVLIMLDALWSNAIQHNKMWWSPTLGHTQAGIVSGVLAPVIAVFIPFFGELSLISMDWFKGKLKTETPIFTGTIYGFL